MSRKAKSHTFKNTQRDQLTESIEKTLPKEFKPTADWKELNDDAPSRLRHVDALSDQIGAGADGYYHKMTWNWLRYDVKGAKYRLSVERYYHTKKVAIDMNVESDDQQFINLKKELCEAHGIQYFWLKNMDDVNDMLKELRPQ